MPVPVKNSPKDDKPTNPQLQADIGKDRGSKEREPKSLEDNLMTEIKTVSEAQDKQALEKLRGSMKEVKQAAPEPELSPDVEDAGVHSPQNKANEVIEKGSTLEIPVSEEVYGEAKKTKVGGKVFNKAVVGVSSLAAVAIWAGRIIKMAHKHAKKIVFRKGEKNAG